MTSSFGSIYNGPEKIVIGIDLGTTMSCVLRFKYCFLWLIYYTTLLGAVSYAHLVPDTDPEVRIVNQWPGQADASGDSKVPRNSFLPCTQIAHAFYLDSIDCSLSQFNCSGFRIPSFGPRSRRSFCGGSQMVQAPVRFASTLFPIYFGLFSALQPAPRFHEIPSELGFE